MLNQLASNVRKILMPRHGERSVAGLAANTDPQDVGRLVLERKQLWLCATPKSASTYINNIISKLMQAEVCMGPPVPFWGDRQQEPDLLSVYLLLKDDARPYFSGHIHQKFTDFFFGNFLKMQSKLGGGAVVQTRDLLDTIVSLKDHVDKSVAKTGIAGPLPWCASLKLVWSGLSDDERYELIAYSYAPWHIDFVNSWKNAPRVLHLSYNDAVTRTFEVVREISLFFGVNKTATEIERAIDFVSCHPKDTNRMNIGKSGRGRDLLPPSLQLWVGELETLAATP